MNKKTKIPKGWRRLRKGERITDKTKWWSDTYFAPCDFTVGSPHDGSGLFIHRISKKKKGRT